MKKNKILLVIIGLIFLMPFFSCLKDKKEDSFVFTDVNVIPMSQEAILTDFDVHVERGKIIEIGPSSSVDIPKGATIINATGKYMIPTLSDMHVHLEGDGWNLMFPDSLKFSKDEIDFNDILFLYIANGITTINVMSALPEHIELRDKINNNEVLGPRLILSRMIDAAGKAWPPPICTGINNTEEAIEAVTNIHELDYDRIKVYSFLDKESYDAIITTAKNLGIPVDGHIPLSTSVEHVLLSGQNMIAHSEEVLKFTTDINQEQIDYYAHLIAKSNTWLNSTLILDKNLIALFKDSIKEFSKEGTEYLHPMGEGIWSYIEENLYKPIPESHRMAIGAGYTSFQKPFTYEFFRSGGKLLIGTDALIPSTLPGFSLHKELQELVDVGLSPFEALKVSTTNTYEFLGELNESGSIEIGKKANFLLLDKNPLDDIKNTRAIYGIMTQDRWISKTDIDDRLSNIVDSYAKLRKSKDLR